MLNRLIRDLFVPLATVKQREAQVPLSRLFKVLNFDLLLVCFVPTVDYLYFIFTLLPDNPGDRPGHSSVSLAECSLLSLVPRKANDWGGGGRKEAPAV